MFIVLDMLAVSGFLQRSGRTEAPSKTKPENRTTWSHGSIQDEENDDFEQCSHRLKDGYAFLLLILSFPINWWIGSCGATVLSMCMCVYAMVVLRWAELGNEKKNINKNTNIESRLARVCGWRCAHENGTRADGVVDMRMKKMWMTMM